jgi:hypothetical protein
MLWDTAKAGALARSFLKKMPWRQMFAWAKQIENERFPETLGQHKRLKAIRSEIEELLLPFAEAPFGYGREGHEPKDWHKPAVWVAEAIIVKFLEAGLPKPPIGQRTALARVVHIALKRIGYEVADVSASGVGVFLARRARRLDEEHAANAKRYGEKVAAGMLLPVSPLAKAFVLPEPK